MNIYLITLIEIVLYTLFALFLGKQLGIFTNYQDIVTLNYIFWGFVIASSILINFHQYLYFGSIFVIGIITMCIYIFKVIGVDYVVDANMTPYFWALYLLFFIVLALIIVTKRVLLTSRRSQAPLGDDGVPGGLGVSGKSYFIESLGDQIYVQIIDGLDAVEGVKAEEGIEEYFRSILDANEIPYDKNQTQFNNRYLKDVINRISHSTQMIEYVSKYKSGHCKYDTTQRVCVDINGAQITKSDNSVVTCSVDSECDKIDTATNGKSEEKRRINNIIEFIKTSWINKILENTKHDNEKLLIKEKNNNFISYVDIDEMQTKMVDNFDKKKRHNNVMGRKFLQSHFELESYWNRVKNLNKENNNYKDPFDSIHIKVGSDSENKKFHNKPVWDWGTSKAASEAQNKCPQ